MTSVASETWGLVFWEQHDTAHAAVVGPETRSDTVAVPVEANYVGIQFAVGVSLRATATPDLVDGGIILPDTTHRTFRLDGARWEIPSPDDAEALADRLLRDGAIVRDPLVADVMRGRRPPVADRTVERRFRMATGLTQGAVRQIGRARSAALLLHSGALESQVVAALGYYDEPHLARALRRYVGHTAGQLRRGLDNAIALDLQAHP